jgi:hypothetical protein
MTFSGEVPGLRFKGSGLSGLWRSLVSALVMASTQGA